VVARHGTTVVLHVAGELDMHTVGRLREGLARALSEHEGGVVVDLTGVGFIDSTGLSALLNAQRRLTRARRRLAVVVDDGPVLRVLRLTRLDSTFTVTASVDAALATLEPGAVA
jgi:anti-sigma B factor antagonist